MTVSLDILSDPICPWCYIGKARLDQALAERPDAPFSIHWRPFQLNPDMPRAGMDRREYLERKFGGPAGARQVYDQIAATAEADGLEVRFDAITRTPNTLDAHRLIRWASPGAQQAALVDALFHAYFVDGVDIGETTALIEIGARVGFEAPILEALFAGEADLDAVRQADAAAREAGVSGVPTFIVGGRHAIPGAQDADLWRRVIAELSAAAPPPS